jgi:chromosome segregation ATPase
VEETVGSQQSVIDSLKEIIAQSTQNPSEQDSGEKEALAKHFAVSISLLSLCTSRYQELQSQVADLEAQLSESRAAESAAQQQIQQCVAHHYYGCIHTKRLSDENMALQQKLAKFAEELFDPSGCVCLWMLFF